MNIDYTKLKHLCQDKGIVVAQALYLGQGILGRFYPPNIILINRQLCNTCGLEYQKSVLVLLHEMCHWLKWQEHPDDFKQKDEEACFEFEVICDRVLNYNEPINGFEAITRLGLQKSISLLKDVMEMCGWQNRFMKING